MINNVDMNKIEEDENTQNIEDMNENIDIDEELDEVIPPEPVDAKIEIEVSETNMEGYIYVSAPEYGGKDITVEDINNALEKEKIISGIDHDIIRRLVEGKEYHTQIQVATGTAPIDGEDGYIIRHFEEKKTLAPKQREDGTVDFKDLGLIHNITKGTEICDIVPPTDGTHGEDIKGKALAPKKGKPAIIPRGTNTGLNADQTKLLSLADGNLISLAGKYTVETAITISEDVGLATGNINFIGDVVVKGNVLEGFAVISDKNITIQGMVYGANIEAGGSITVRNGAINSTLTAKQNITCKFAENCKIYSHKDIKADSLILCETKCLGELTAVGQPGVIMGGVHVVTNNVTANYIGSKSYMHTSITVGDHAILFEEKMELEKQIAQIDGEILRYDQAIEYLEEIKKTTQLPPEREVLLGNAKKMKIRKGIEKNPILRRIKEIDTFIGAKKNLRVACQKVLYPNVKITLSSFVLNVEQENSRCRVYVDKEDGIIIRPL